MKIPSCCVGWAAAAALLLARQAAANGSAAAASPTEVQSWFQATEQKLMDSVGSGDKGPWQEIMDPACVVTSEEGQVMTRQQFLDEIRPLPPGLAGGITVKDLTVQEHPGLAVVRYLADERETVFGQRLTTRYRVTDTYRRLGRDWKLVASHASVVTQDPPAQEVSSADWPAFVGTYRLMPDGWTFTVELRDGKLYGGRDPKNLLPLVPLTANAFVVSGRLGEWIFVTEKGRAVRILNLRKFEPLIWTRVDG